MRVAIEITELPQKSLTELYRVISATFNLLKAIHLESV